MVRLINRDTGGDMWVHESRLQEYLAAGHKPAAGPAATQDTRAVEDAGPHKGSGKGPTKAKGTRKSREE